jgi:predicted DNA-binding protein
MGSVSEKRKQRTAAGEDVHEMLVRIPRDLHAFLRTKAYDEDRHKSELIREALSRYLAKNTKPKPRIQSSDVHKMLVRIPVSLHELLRQRAFDQHRHKSEIINEALDAYLR